MSRVAGLVFVFVALQIGSFGAHAGKLNERAENDKSKILVLVEYKKKKNDEIENKYLDCHKLGERVSELSRSIKKWEKKIEKYSEASEQSLELLRNKLKSIQERLKKAKGEYDSRCIEEKKIKLKDMDMFPIKKKSIFDGLNCALSNLLLSLSKTSKLVFAN